MIAYLPLLCLIAYSLVMTVRSTMGATPQTSPRRQAIGQPAARPAEDPAQWRADGTCWTELDERQLIRLLTDSAS